MTQLHTQIVEIEKALLDPDSMMSAEEKRVAEKELTKIRGEADAEVANIKEVLKTRLALVDQGIKTMSKMDHSEKVDKVELSMSRNRYNAATEEYEQARDLYREVKLQQQEQHAILKMPFSPVTIFERAR